MDVATSMYDHNRSGAPMQHMNRTSATSYHHQPAAAGGGVSNAMSAVSDIHKRDKELIYGYVRMLLAINSVPARIFDLHVMLNVSVTDRSTDLSVNLSDHTPKLSNVA